jgi:hypothetical protein
MFNARMRSATLGVALLFAGACSYLGYINFRKPLTPNEFALQQQIENLYYEDMDSAFFSGNVEALAGLYSPEISVPMDWNKIHVWAVNFFKAHPSSHFKVNSISVDQMSYVRAVVRVRYSIVTVDGAGGFSGAERDVLIHKKKHWFISSWEKLTDKNAASSPAPNSGHEISFPFDSGESPASRGD